MSLFTQMEGDWNGDFTVDAADVGIAASRQGQSFNPASGPGGGGVVTAVPEPASLGILAIGATSLLRRRRRA
jgi:hypothetical protein